jgi:YqaJ-like viral recombinase domain
MEEVMVPEQGSEAWLQQRVGKATASKFAAIMSTKKGGGETAVRRDYRVELVVERLTGRPTPVFESWPMRQGREREPLARTVFEVQTGIFVHEAGFVEHEELMAGASPDGLIAADGGLELKCPTASTHFDYLRLPDGTCPEDYEWQVHGGMWVTGRKFWYFGSFNPEFPENLQLVVRRIERDEAKIAALDAGVRQFLIEVASDHQFALTLNGGAK